VLDGVRVLTDPVLRDRIAHLRRDVSAPAPEVTTELDAVLLSHRHRDHLDLPSLRRLDRDVTMVAPVGAGDALRRAAFTSVTEVRAGDEVSVGALNVEVVPAQHDGRRQPIGPAAPAVGYVVAGSRRIYFAGDTDLFDDMARMAGRLDVALLPVAGWGARLGPGHLDPQRAARAAALLAPRVAVPIHWGTLSSWGARRTSDPERPPERFAAQVAAVAPSVAVAVLEPGASLELESALGSA
jgi:L-ascorbate metabolism protein UlaG (beta-lactamase superfamily)